MSEYIVEATFAPPKGAKEEIVRCCDCRHFFESSPLRAYCKQPVNKYHGRYTEHPAKWDGFCSEAERFLLGG